jgi:hypothetical protein
MAQHRPWWSTYIVFCVEIGAEFEQRACDVNSVSFTCVMKRCFSSFYKFYVHRCTFLTPFAPHERERTLFAALGSWPISTSSSTIGKWPLNDAS